MEGSYILPSDLNAMSLLHQYGVQDGPADINRYVFGPPGPSGVYDDLETWLNGPGSLILRFWLDDQLGLRILEPECSAQPEITGVLDPTDPLRTTVSWTHEGEARCNMSADRFKLKLTGTIGWPYKRNTTIGPRTASCGLGLACPMEPLVTQTSRNPPYALCATVLLTATIEIEDTTLEREGSHEDCVPPDYIA